MTCSECAFENRALAAYCGRCGAALRSVVECRQCGRTNPIAYRYCDGCGAEMFGGDVLGGDGPAARAGAPDDVVAGQAGRRLGRRIVASPGAQAVPRSDAPDSTTSTVASLVSRPNAALPEKNGHTLSDQLTHEPPVNAASPNADDTEDRKDNESGPSRLPVSQGAAQILTAVGVLAAVAAQAYLQFGAPSNWTKAGGLSLLVAGAVLFGLGGVQSWLRPVRRWTAADQLLPFRVIPRGPALLTAGTGSVVFVTLLGRLWSGSTAATDLILWLIALASFTIALVPAWPSWRPTRSAWLETGAVGLVVAVFIALNAHDLNDWYYSAIGDEYAFLAAASGVLADGIRKPFSQDGVYGAHPVLGTLVQAAVMRIFGNNHFGWLFSSVLSAALAIPAIYLIGRTLGGPAVGMVAAALFGFNHYLFAFAHIGYNNVMAPAPTAWAIALFLLSWRRPSVGLLFASGVAAGLGFYTFYSARTTIPIIGLFLILHASWRDNLSWRHWREQVLRFWPMALGLVLAAGPIFAASGLTVITRMFNEVPGGYDASVTGPPGQKILSNFWLNVPAFFYNTHVAHYISGSLLDPVAAALAALGIGLAIRCWGHAGVKLVLVWALVAVSTTALLSPHLTTAVTRLLFDIPPLAILGALAARQIWETVTADHELLASSRVAAAAVAALMVVVLGVNVHRFWYVTPTRYHLINDAIVVGALHSPLCQNDPARAVVVMRGHGLLRGALTSYRPERDLPRLVTHEQLRPGQPIPLDGANCVVFGHPEDEPEKVALADLLRTVQGSMVSPFRDRAGIGTVMVFTPTQR